MSGIWMKERKPVVRVLNHPITRFAAGSLLLALLILPLLPHPGLATPGILAWLGRFHPVIVHLPLALVPVLFLFELAAVFHLFEIHLPTKKMLWLLALAGALFSVLAGYLLFGSGEYEGELMQEHFWGGVFSTILIGLSTWLAFAGNTSSARSERESGQKIYPGLVVLSLLCVLYTGHHGGMLTHGTSFIEEAWPISLKGTDFQDKPAEELLLFEDLILPVLDQRCASCHNDNKTKGGLKLSNLQQLMAGGDSDQPSILPGEAANSLLYHRITLPASDDDRMPPDGKAGLNASELELIAWWINEGASAEMQYGAGPEDSLLAFQFTQLINKQRQLRRQRALKKSEVVRIVDEINREFTTLNIEPDLATRETSIAVSMKFPPEPVDDETIAALISRTSQISSLSLLGSDITDDALYHIGQLQSLQSLYLTQTGIDGSGLNYLVDLPQLQRINISNTHVTNDAVLQLTRMPALQEVYLHGTQVDSLMVDALSTFMPEVEFSLSVGPIHH